MIDDKTVTLIISQSPLAEYYVDTTSFLNGCPSLCESDKLVHVLTRFCCYREEMNKGEDLAKEALRSWLRTGDKRRVQKGAIAADGVYWTVPDVGNDETPHGELDETVIPKTEAIGNWGRGKGSILTRSEFARACG
jgi:hypothetical protein